MHSVRAGHCHLIGSFSIAGFTSDILKLHSKKCWVISTQMLVKYGQTQMLV